MIAEHEHVPAPRHPVYSTNPNAAVAHISDAGRGVLAACVTKPQAAAPA